MPVQFAYGMRDAQRVYVGDLDVQTDRGIRCRCTCSECGQPLEAHLGTQKSWHFQHATEDRNCNPQPMTLLHAFIRDELASRRALSIPALKVPYEIEEAGSRWSYPIDMEACQFSFLTGTAELRLDGIQPDVVFELEDGNKFAVEVRYSHAVDEVKRTLLRRSFSLAAELDVSDLPAGGIGASQLPELLADPRRWTWLVNGSLDTKQRIARNNLRWWHTTWTVRSTSGFEVPRPARPATAKLKQVDSLMFQARMEVARLVDKPPPQDVSRDWLGKQNKLYRVAISCAALRLDPLDLPVWFNQLLHASPVEPSIKHHPYSWQVVLFMKFGIGRERFTSHQAARWAVKAMPDRVDSAVTTTSANRFSWPAAAIHRYFLHLEAQGLLESDGSRNLEARVFSPCFSKVRDLHLFLHARQAPSLSETA